MKVGEVRLWLLAWLATVASWMVLADSVRPAELFAGAVVAAIAATGFELVRRQRVTEQAVRLDLSLRLWRPFLRAFPDLLRLTRAAVRQLVRREPVVGRTIAMPFGYSADDPDDRARRAVAVGFGSMAPNTVVVGVDHETGDLLVHQLEVTGAPDDLDPLRLR